MKKSTKEETGSANYAMEIRILDISIELDFPLTSGFKGKKHPKPLKSMDFL